MLPRSPTAGRAHFINESMHNKRHSPNTLHNDIHIHKYPDTYMEIWKNMHLCTYIEHYCSWSHTNAAIYMYTPYVFMCTYLGRMREVMFECLGRQGAPQAGMRLSELGSR